MLRDFWPCSCIHPTCGDTLFTQIIITWWLISLFYFVLVYYSLGFLNAIPCEVDNWLTDRKLRLWAFCGLVSDLVYAFFFLLIKWFKMVCSIESPSGPYWTPNLHFQKVFRSICSWAMFLHLGRLSLYLHVWFKFLLVWICRICMMHGLWHYVVRIAIFAKFWIFVYVDIN